MPKKGKVNNPAGRPMGSANKISKDLRQSITDFLNENFEKVKADMMKLQSKERVKFFIDLLKYSVPTLQSTQLTTDFEKLSDEQLDKIINELKATVYEDKA